MGRTLQRTLQQLLLLLVLGQILFLIISQVGSTPVDKTIRIGYLLQFVNRAGAINVAIEQAQNDSLLRGYNFRYKCCTCLLYLKLSLTTKHVKNVVYRHEAYTFFSKTKQNQPFNQYFNMSLVRRSP